MEEFYYFEYKSFKEEFMDLIFCIANMDILDWIKFLGVVLILLVIVIAMLVFEIYFKEKYFVWIPKCYREEMMEDGGVIISINDNNEVDNVSGSLLRYIRTIPESTVYDDDEIRKIFIKYCYYVDKNYGTEPKYVWENIHKDVKDMLDCKFM